MSRHIMVDLETMGATPGSVIASIGAVAFDPYTGQEWDSFYRVVDMQSCQDLGLKIEADTVAWWLKQSEGARAALGREGHHLAKVLQDFTAFWQASKGKFFWSHGANFDEPLLGVAYRACQAKAPWSFYNSRCTRTLYDLANVKPARDAGTHHNALDDARAQAQAVATSYLKLGITQPVAA